MTTREAPLRDTLGTGPRSPRLLYGRSTTHVGGPPAPAPRRCRANRAPRRLISTLPPPRPEGGGTALSPSLVHTGLSPPSASTPVAERFAASRAGTRSIRSPLPVRPFPAAPGLRLVAARDQPFDDLADGLGSPG
jgi:hypothetical protein